MLRVTIAQAIVLSMAMSHLLLIIVLALALVMSQLFVSALRVLRNHSLCAMSIAHSMSLAHPAPCFVFSYMLRNRGHFP